MHIGKVIENLGYPKNEVKIYLAALDIGESTITELALNLNMPRTSVQSTIEDMHSRGLMNYYLKKRRKIWVAENPDKLMIKLKESEAALKMIMPELQAKRFSHGGRPLVRLYNGVEQIKLVVDEIIATQRNMLAIKDWDEWVSVLGKEFADEFVERRCSHFLNIKLLTVKTSASVELKQQDERQLRHTRFLPLWANIKTTNFIFGNTVAIVLLNKRLPVAIVVEDPSAAHAATIFFESLWHQSLDH